MMRSTTSLSLALLLVCAGCGGEQTTPSPSASPSASPTASPTASPAGEQKSLYDRLGGKPAIEKVVGDFLGIVAKDDRINKFFAKTDIPKLQKLVVDQVCEATGGPCTYTGKDMATAHRGIAISEADFTAFVEDLTKALDANKVPEKEKSDLLGALGSMKKDIVTNAQTSGEIKTLFERLGGKAAIEAVISDFLGNVAADKRINGFFAKADIPKLKQLLVDQVCEATGGPCKYAGKSMADAHKDMKITEEQFNALVEDLVKSLDTFKVPAKEKGELLSALGGLKGDIVGK